VVDFVRDFSARTELAVTRVVGWVGIARGKYFDWCQRYGQANEHNALVPRDHWIAAEERQAILDYFDGHPLEGYRRLTFMMLDDDVVAVSPATTYRVLARAGRLDRWARRPSKKGTGFVQPLRPHEHWHIDVSYLNLGGTFYYLCSVLDGASRAIIHWDLRESMKEYEVECILERAKELYPEARQQHQNVRAIEWPGRALGVAYICFGLAGALKTAARIKLAINSAKGAKRNAERYGRPR
jgi:transposase InsO family protein